MAERGKICFLQGKLLSPRKTTRRRRVPRVGFDHFYQPRKSKTSSCQSAQRTKPIIPKKGTQSNPNLCLDKNCFPCSWRTQSGGKDSSASISNCVRPHGWDIYGNLAIFSQHCRELFYLCVTKTQTFSKTVEVCSKGAVMLPPPEITHRQHIFSIVSPVTNFHREGNIWSSHPATRPVCACAYMYMCLYMW
jgi:hypothetical protein